MDRLIDMAKLVLAFRNFANASQNGCRCSMQFMMDIPQQYYPGDQVSQDETGGACGKGKGKGKGKVHPITSYEGPEVEYRYSATRSLASSLDCDGWSTPRPDRFTPGKGPVPFVQDAGCDPGPVQTVAEILAPTGIRSTDGPARSESLYRLRYPDLRGVWYVW